MEKVSLRQTNKEDFMEYAKNRRDKRTDFRNLSYLTDAILSNVYDFFLKNDLTVKANASSYWYRNGKIEMMCYGYSGYSINERDDFEGIVGNLFHEVWCKAEWLARSVLDDWYIDSVRAYFGNYKKLLY